MDLFISKFYTKCTVVLSQCTTKESRQAHDWKPFGIHALQDLTDHHISDDRQFLLANPIALDEVGHNGSQHWSLLNVLTGDWNAVLHGFQRGEDAKGNIRETGMYRGIELESQQIVSFNPNNYKTE